MKSRTVFNISVMVCIALLISAAIAIPLNLLPKGKPILPTLFDETTLIIFEVFVFIVAPILMASIVYLLCQKRSDYKITMINSEEECRNKFPSDDKEEETLFDDPDVSYVNFVGIKKVYMTEDAIPEGKEKERYIEHLKGIYQKTLKPMYQEYFSLVKDKDMQPEYMVKEYYYFVSLYNYNQRQKGLKTGIPFNEKNISQDHYDKEFAAFLQNKHQKLLSENKPVLSLEKLGDSSILTKNPQEILLLNGIKNNDLTQVKEALQKGIEVDTADEEGSTVLHYAANAGHTRIIQTLLENKADVNHQNKDGYTALHWAALSDKTEAVKLLLESQADPSISHNNGIFAAQLADDDPATKECFSKRYTTFLFKPMQNLQEVLFNGVKNNDLEQVKEALQQNDIEVNATDEEGLTALHHAANFGWTLIIQLLLENKADINYQDKNGYTALHWAASSDKTEAVKLLLEFRADSSIRNNNGIFAGQLTDDPATKECFSKRYATLLLQ